MQKDTAPRISPDYKQNEKIVVYKGNCIDLFKKIPDKTIQLIVTSPPYNLGKEYEKRLHLKDYIAQQKAIILESKRVLKDNGSICWQVGNYIENGIIAPLDIILYPIFIKLGFKLRNR